MTDKSIADRLSDLESKMDFLIYKESSKTELTHPEFITFYNRIEKMLPGEDIIPCVIWLDEHFADSLKHKVLYLDDESGYWYPIGKTLKNTPVAFKSLPRDFVIDCVIAGNFEGTKQ